MSNIKKAGFIICSVVFSSVLLSGSCDRKYDYTPERQWWNSLNETWQIVFLREIDKLNQTPSDEDLKKILQLESVECDHFPIGEAGLEPLIKLKRLKSLSAGSTHISDINPLEKLGSLVFVNFANTSIQDINALENHHNLESVYIQQTLVKDLNPLKDKNKLQVLVIDQTPIKTLIPLMNLPQLNIVSFSGTKISKQEVQAFVAKYPDCDISY